MRKNKFLAVLLSLIVALSILPATALAEEADEPTDVPVALAAEGITTADDLLTAVNAGGEARLGSDLTVDFPASITKDFSLDLGGNTLTLSNDGSTTVSEGATLILKNGSIATVDGKFAANKAVLSATKNSSIELNGVNFTTSGAALFPLGDAAKITVINSTVTGAVYAVGTNAGAVDNHNVEIVLKDSTFNGASPVFLNIPGTLEMSGCIVKGIMHGVVVRGGTAVIQDSAITQTYTDDDAQTMASYFDNQNWGSGNMVNLGALVVGNKAPGSYQYPSDVTLINTNVSTAGGNAALFPALYATANQGEGLGVTLVYDDQCAFYNGTENPIQVSGGNAVVGEMVAEVNGVPYATLQAAIDAAEASDTVKLLNDVDWPKSGSSPDVFDISGLTIDLNGHTLSAQNFTLVFEGSDFTIKNGFLNAYGGSYALFIGDEGTTNDVVVENVKTTGGINVFNAKNVVLKNVEVDASETSYYAVWCDEEAYVVIESGTYRSGKTGAVVGLTNVNNEGGAKAELIIKGGTFIAEDDISLVLQGDYFEPAISGGNFSAPVPEKYLVGVDTELYSTAVNSEAPYSYYNGVTAAIDAAAKAKDTDAQITILNENANLTVAFAPNGGTMSISSIRAKAGETLALPTPTWSGYTFQGWYAGSTKVGNGGDSYTVTEGVTLTAQWKKMETTTPSKPSTSSWDDDDDGYTVNVPSSSSIKNGSITVSPRTADKNDTVTITVKPDAGYELDTLTVTDASGKTVRLTEKTDNKYTFTMPASKVSIQVSFAKIADARRFTDVPDGYWAEDEIGWAAENGYINGNTATTYNPEGPVTRQQLWMILARLSGNQPADFAAAKAWAVDNGISDGTNPGAAVSRQQLVTILYRWAQKMGYSVEGSADLTAFPDHASVAAYAQAPMSWSVANGIIGGTAQGTLAPAGTTTRAQFAVILYRFYENIING